MKKVYNAPYLKVVEIKNDILTNSLNNEEGDGYQLIQGRQDFFEDDEF